MGSNYPPGVTGREYAIGGAEREWEQEAECPHCGWLGAMLHEQHYEFGIRAFCANPERVEVYRNEHGYTTGQCPLVREGFEVEPPEAEYDPYDHYGTPEHEAWLIEMERQEG